MGFQKVQLRRRDGLFEQGAQVAQGGGRTPGTSASLQISNHELNLLVSLIPTTTTLSSSSNPSTYGVNVDLTAALKTNGVVVGSAAGIYVFKVDGLAVATNPVSGGLAGCTLTNLAARAYTISAEYAGDATYAPSTNSLSQTVNPAVSSLSLSSSAPTNGYRAPVFFIATNLPVGAGSNVVFSANGVAFSTNGAANGGATSLVLTNLPRAGTNSIVAFYTGDGNYLPASTNLIQTVTNHPPTAMTMSVARSAGISLKIPLADLATNWSDPDGDPVRLMSISLKTTNSVAVYRINVTTQPDGSYAITNSAYIGVPKTPNQNDQIVCAISDDQGGTNYFYIDIVVSTSPLFGQTTGIMPSGGGAVTVKFAGNSGYTFNVQRSTNLVSWVTIWTTNAPSGLFNYTDGFGDLGGIAPGSAYYRLSWSP